MKALRNRAVLAFLLFNLLAGILYVGGALLVSFMRSFGATPAQLGLILGAGWVASVLGALIGGDLADRIGPRKTVLLTTALVTLGLLGKALSRHWLQAGAWHLLGMGAQAALFPASVALLKGEMGEEVGSPLGFLNTAFSVVAIPGAALTGWVVERWGWPTLFLGKFATYLVALPLLLLLLPKVSGEAEEQEEEKGKWRQALAHPPLLLVCASVFVVTLGGYCYAYYPYFVQERFAANVQRLALFDSIYNGVWMLSNWPAGLLADRVGRGRVAMTGYGLMGLAWFLFPFSPFLPLTYLFYALYCLGNSMGFYASVFVIDVAPETLKGRAVGLFNAAMYLGSALGDGVGGTLWQLLGARFSFALAAGAFLLGTSLLFGGRRVARGR
jgi:predicted MFS family arabinose efflux permease